MGKYIRPKFRWANKYLPEITAPDGTVVPHPFTEPNYVTFNKELEPPFPKDNYYKRNEKYFITGGCYLFISKLLNEKGPLTTKEVFAYFQRDPTVDRNDVNIRSITQLRLDLLKRMLKEELLVKAGYSHLLRRNLGYQVNPEKAFARVHPAILFSLSPVPDCYLVRRYKGLVEGGEASKEIEERQK